MRATVMHGPRDVRFEQVPEPRIEQPTDAIVRLAASCICGSDLWAYRGLRPIEEPMLMGHEYCGTVVAVGSQVRSVRVGDFVVGSFCFSDLTCPHCLHGFPSACERGDFMRGAQAPLARVQLADGTLLPMAPPPPELIPSLLAASDVLGTGWYAAEAAGVQPGMTVAVVGDGAVGLMGVLAARQMGAARVIAMSRHPARQQRALEFGATDIVEQRGPEGVAEVKRLTGGVGADAVLECVGTQQAMLQAIHAARPGAVVGCVGVPHGVALDGQELFFAQVGIRGGPAPVRRYLPHLVDLIQRRVIDPGRVFDLELPLEEVAEGYRAMDERRAIKTLLRV